MCSFCETGLFHMGIHIRNENILREKLLEKTAGYTNSCISVCEYPRHGHPPVAPTGGRVPWPNIQHRTSHTDQAYLYLPRTRTDLYIWADAASPVALIGGSV